MAKMDLLTKGTTLVVASGVVFDLWVSLWLTDKPDTKTTKTITISIVSVLIFGLGMMYFGWVEQKQEGQA